MIQNTGNNASPLISFLSFFFFPPFCWNPRIRMNIFTGLAGGIICQQHGNSKHMQNHIYIYINPLNKYSKAICLKALWDFCHFAKRRAWQLYATARCWKVPCNRFLNWSNLGCDSAPWPPIMIRVAPNISQHPNIPKQKGGKIAYI